MCHSNQQVSSPHFSNILLKEAMDPLAFGIPFAY
jgi:hypothetical protein